MSEDRQLRALEAVRHVEVEYGLRTASLKPCIAFLLDGNIGGATRHEAAFVIAIDCRRMGLTEHETEAILTRWATKIGYGTGKACSAIRNAYAKKNNSYQYFPPGITKRPGTGYERVLAATCADVGCPQNCPPYVSLHHGPRGQGYERFKRLGWTHLLRRQRHMAAADVYHALCEFEEKYGFVAGAPLHTTYKQLAELADRDHAHVGHHLQFLYELGLLSSFERGSGSGPHARDRVASRIARTVPIPPVPTAATNPAITTGDRTQPRIGSEPPPEIGDLRPPNIGGASETENGDPALAWCSTCRAWKQTHTKPDYPSLVWLVCGHRSALTPNGDSR